MSTSITLNHPETARNARPGVIGQLIAWLKRRTATTADANVWHGGARGL